MADEWYNASEDIDLPMIGENWDCFYDENYTYQWDDGKLSIFDGENCLYILEYPIDKWYVNGNNARLENGIFYGASVMNGYARPDMMISIPEHGKVWVQPPHPKVQIPCERNPQQIGQHQPCGRFRDAVKGKKIPSQVEEPDRPEKIKDNR